MAKSTKILISNPTFFCNIESPLNYLYNDVKHDLLWIFLNFDNWAWRHHIFIYDVITIRWNMSLFPLQDMIIYWNKPENLLYNIVEGRANFFANSHGLYMKIWLPVVWILHIIWNANRNICIAVTLRGQPTSFDQWFTRYEISSFACLF